MATLKLGYWQIRGYGEAIRNLLRYCNVPFEDVRYDFGSGAEFPNREEWLKEKFSLDLPFPNLPYLIDGDLRLTQSVAILKHLARKYDLIADGSANSETLAYQDMLEAQIIDIRNRLIIALYYKSFSTDSDFEAELDSVRSNLAVNLAQLEQWIGEKQWLVGDKLTYVDFLAYEYLDWYRAVVQADCFDKFPRMAAYMKRFEELPPLKEYLASDEYRKGHCLSPFAKLGY